MIDLFLNSFRSASFWRFTAKTGQHFELWIRLKCHHRQRGSVHANWEDDQLGSTRKATGSSYSHSSDFLVKRENSRLFHRHLGSRGERNEWQRCPSVLRARRSWRSAELLEKSYWAHGHGWSTETQDLSRTIRPRSFASFAQQGNEEILRFWIKPSSNFRFLPIEKSLPRSNRRCPPDHGKVARRILRLLDHPLSENVDARLVRHALC